MNPLHRRAPWALAATGALVAGPLVAAPASAAPVEIQVIGINDLHGRIQPLDDGDTPDDPSDDVGGAAMLAGAVRSFRDANPNTIFVSAGDNVGASPFVSAVAEDRPTIEALNAMALEASAVGNHEFDRGYDWLASASTHGVDGTGLAEWPTLGANVEGESPEMPEYDVVTVGSGDTAVDVGFVGVVTEQTATLVSPDGIAGITFTDPVDAANDVAAALTDGEAGNGEADVLVLLAHEGSEATDCEQIEADPAFGGFVTDLDPAFTAVLSGHTHNAYACEFEVDGRTLAVVQTGQYGEALDRVSFTYDTANGDVTLNEAEVVANTGFTPDPDVAALVAAAVAEAEVIGEEPVGEITQDITRAFTDGEEDRGQESVLGNFIADVQLAATADPGLGGAQIAFMNPGGLRADFCMAAGETTCPEPTDGDGVVTYGEGATVQPFANGVITMTLTGEQVESVLEEQWQPAGASRPFLALGVSDGFFYTYDPDAAQGERITSMTLDGEAVDPGAEYRVTVNSFLAAGGDNFTTLTEGTERQDTGFNDLNVLVSYFEQNSPITPDTESRREIGAGSAVEPRPVDDSCLADWPPAGFTDVPADWPFRSVIDCLAVWDITRGTSETTYSPLQPVSRGQMAAFVSRLVTSSGGTLPENPEDAFGDDEASAYEADINALAAAGIVNGTSTEEYSPRMAVTRAQMAALLVRAYNYRADQAGAEVLTPSTGDFFPDDETSTLEGDINTVASAGVAAGFADGTFRPRAAVRRDHMAAFLTRTLDLMVENELAELPQP